MAFYVTAFDDSKFKGFAAGPFESHDEALAAVDPVRFEAAERDGATWFYAWGTARADGPATCPLNYAAGLE